MARSFELARREHAEAIQGMRVAASKDLLERFGPGPWGSGGRLESIERSIRDADTGRDGHGAMYVVLEDGLCIGSVGLATRSEDFWPRDCWQNPQAPSLNVFGLCIHPSHQRAGAGTFLMESAATLARRLDYSWIRLDAYEQNAMSNAFYKKLGYSLRAKVIVNGNSLVVYETAV